MENSDQNGAQIGKFLWINLVTKYINVNIIKENMYGLKTNEIIEPNSYLNEGIGHVIVVTL